MDTARDTTQIAPLQDAAPRVLRNLGAAGTLEVLRITKGLQLKGEELLFVGVAGRQGSKARMVRVRFTEGALPRQPRFDDATGTIELYYPHRDHAEVQALLNARRTRFCYFWRSAQGGQTHAWLLSSP
ncbi:MAG: hypothetical protein IPM46_02160 [Flavobacteriales bacterium]|nr:hypothetical protein [Flavobacteriales bacterium]